MTIVLTDADDVEGAVAAVRAWVEEHVPARWREAAAGGPAAIRAVRPRADYEAWYPVFGASGLVAPAWPVAWRGPSTTSCDPSTSAA